MVSKIKYVAIFLGSIGYWMKAVHVDLNLGFLTIQGNTLLTVALFLIAVYAAAKFFGK